MNSTQLFIIIAFVFGFRLDISGCVSSIKFTNLECVPLDKPFADFHHCKLKALSRDKVALSLRVNLFQVPVNNVSLNVESFKKYNGYRPYLVNVTTNFCDFLRHKKRLAFLDIIFQFLEKYSNINHTCPFDHDIIVDKLILMPKYFSMLPVPAGEYRLRIVVGAYNDWKAVVNIFVQIWE
ncbi:uncharacterized protein LOC105665269 [Ceratitis capitata]|uniref:uncharacterized protein LOC105665269 n=1 Tax=Ceratitis capitata TaxID=7213 RepID=UPI000A0FED82|nr:uncharacterized protein LOC105665269 [Ceratitis capitata]